MRGAGCSGKDEDAYLTVPLSRGHLKGWPMSYSVPSEVFKVHPCSSSNTIKGTDILTLMYSGTGEF